MPTTGLTYLAVSACEHALPAELIPSRPRSRELAFPCHTAAMPTVVGAVFPGPASFKPAPGQLSDRSRRLHSGPQTSAWPPHGLVRVPGPPRSPCPGRPHSRIRFTCNCSSGLPQHYLDAQLIPAGTCYVHRLHRGDRSVALSLIADWQCSNCIKNERCRG
jgi:hypothetical protein